MIPPAHSSPGLIQLEELLESDSDISKFPPLPKESLTLLAIFIQIYNYIELNLRRTIEAFAAGGLLPDLSKKKIQSLRSQELIPIAKLAVGNMGLGDGEASEILGKLDEIESRRSYRNLFAHWAARKIGDDAVIFLSLSHTDVKQALGQPLDEGFIARAIMEMADIRGLIAHMLTYEKWIAEKTAEWYKKYATG